MSTVLLLMVGVLLIYSALGSDLLEYVLGRNPGGQPTRVA